MEIPKAMKQHQTGSAACKEVGSEERKGRTNVAACHVLILAEELSDPCRSH